MRHTTALLVLLGLALLLLGCANGTASPQTTATRPHTGAIREFALPTTCGSDCRLVYITNGPDGNVWFTEAGGNKIGRITPTGSITEFSLPTCGGQTCYLGGITSGPDGNLWFTEQFGNNIGRITPSGSFQEFASCRCASHEITSGPDGNLWFTETEGIGQISP